MAKAQDNKNSLKLMKTTLVVTSLSMFVVVVFGYAIFNLRSSIAYLNDFLVYTDDIAPNFEQSLALYSESTKDQIDYLLELRPEAEEEYVMFISEVEAIGADMGLDLDLSSLDVDGRRGAIPYRVVFWGRADELEEFLRRLEALPYMIGVEEISFRDLKFVDVEERDNENVEILIQLFVK